MSVTRLLIICCILAAVGCTKMAKEFEALEASKGCEATCEWCYNFSVLCLETEGGVMEKESDDKRGEPGVGVEILKK